MHTFISTHTNIYTCINIFFSLYCYFIFFMYTYIHAHTHIHVAGWSSGNIMVFGTGGREFKSWHFFNNIQNSIPTRD